MAFGPNDRKGTGFTNINRVLQANQGNKLGSSVASGVQKQATNVRTQAQQSQQKFQEEANKNRLDTQEASQKRDEIIGRFGQSGTTQNQQAPALAGTQEVASKVGAANAVTPPNASNFNQPTQQAPASNAAPQSGAQPIVSDQEIQDFTKFRTGTYTGPQSLQDYQTLQGNAMEAGQLGDLTRSSGGRQELLRRFVGGDGYNQGQQRLDTLLLGQSGTQGLNQARRSTLGLEGDVAAANQNAANLAQEYTNRAKIFGEETVGKLTAARDPISQQVDARLKQIQDEDAARKGFFGNLQGTFLDTNENTKGLDRMTRLGLGLQSAMDAGYLTQAQANQLLGEGGLIQRGEQLGLDTNKLLNERLQDIAAQNINRGGAATAEQEAKLSGLDRLLGKQGTDVEFGQEGADYVKGSLGFNLDSLNDYISKTEKEKYANDAAKQAELEAYNQRYLNQSIANAQGAVGSALQAGMGAANQFLDPQSYYNPGQMGQNLANVQQGAGGATIQGVNSLAQGQNAMLEGLTKLNIGGQSLANTEGGRQLLKAIELKSKLENEAAKYANQANQELASGTQSLLSGRAINDLNKNLIDIGGNVGGKAFAAGTDIISDQLGGLSADLLYNPAKQSEYLGNLLKNTFTNPLSSVGNAVGGDVGKTLSNVGNIGGKAISSVGKSVGSATKSVKKKLKKMFSDEDLKHDIQPADNKLYQLLDKLNAHEYEYDEEVGEPGKHISVMAQELEKSDLGEDAVEDHEMGKMVDYEKLEPVQLAAMSSLHKRLKKLEGKK